MCLSRLPGTAVNDTQNAMSHVLRDFEKSQTHFQTYCVWLKFVALFLCMGLGAFLVDDSCIVQSQIGNDDCERKRVHSMKRGNPANDKSRTSTIRGHGTCLTPVIHCIYLSVYLWFAK